MHNKIVAINAIQNGKPEAPIKEAIVETETKPTNQNNQIEIKTIFKNLIILGIDDERSENISINILEKLPINITFKTKSNINKQINITNKNIINVPTIGRDTNIKLETMSRHIRKI